MSMIWSARSFDRVGEGVVSEQHSMNRVKDSSDEFNSLPTPATQTTKPKSLTDYLALAIATCGVGYLPLAPGTWGSLVGVAIYIGVGSFVSRLVNIIFTPDRLLIRPVL